MNTRSKSTLFLIEQLIVIAVFAISAAACITILTSAYFTSVESRDIKYAILAAENVAETFKATNGSPESITRLLGGSYENISFDNGTNGVVTTINYNSKWQVSDGTDVLYTLKLFQDKPPESLVSVISGHILVIKISDVEYHEIISFPVAVQMPAIGGEANE